MPAVDLRTFLAATTRKPTFDVPAPELGEGATVRVRYLTLADRIAVEHAQEDADRTTAGKLLHHLALCLADETGGRLYCLYDDHLPLIPSSLAERVVIEAMRASTAGVADAKKPSPPTPNSA